MEKVTTLSAPNVATSFHIVLFRLWISRNIKLNCSKVMRFIREIWLRECQLSYKMLGVYQKSAFFAALWLLLWDIWFLSPKLYRNYPIKIMGLSAAFEMLKRMAVALGGCIDSALTIVRKKERKSERARLPLLLVLWNWVNQFETGIVRLTTRGPSFLPISIACSSDGLLMGLSRHFHSMLSIRNFSKSDATVNFDLRVKFSGEVLKECGSAAASVYNTKVEISECKHGWKMATWKI